MELLKHLSQRQYIDGEWVESANKDRYYQSLQSRSDIYGF